MRTDLVQASAGSYVFVGNRTRNVRQMLLQIVKVTPTQILCEGERRYDRAHGFPKGFRDSTSGIISVATAEEIAEWKQQKSAEKAERERREQLNAVREDKRLELQKLCGEGCNVESCTDDPQTWEVTLPNLTEDEVRLLVNRLSSFPSLIPNEKIKACQNDR